MQVVKNLFLWPSRSYVRKAIEIALAYLVEALWPKERILEIYLNIAEWGDGVFGAEAAARTPLAKPALRLTTQEAALMVVALPSPLERSPGLPSAATSRLAGRLLLRMATSRIDLACVRSGESSQAKSAPRAVPPQPRRRGRPRKGHRTAIGTTCSRAPIDAISPPQRWSSAAAGSRAGRATLSKAHIDGRSPQEG